MRALIISADCFEDSELTEPLSPLRTKGGRGGRGRAAAGLYRWQAWLQGWGRGLALDAVRPEDYDLLVLSGGKAPVTLQKNSHAVAIARYFLAAGKPVAAICLPWAPRC